MMPLTAPTHSDLPQPGLYTKIIEKAIVKRLDNHMTTNDLHENFQSAYRVGHSTETALVRIHNDILRALDNKRGVILVMLDLSAAFDTIDHTILIDRLQQRLGIKDVALNWFKEYHTDPGVYLSGRAGAYARVRLHAHGFF